MHPFAGSAYATSKAALAALTREMSADFAPRGIRVNAISPGEIEDALLAHPEVRDAAVVGVPDEQWGEAVAAAIVLRANSRVRVSELQQWVKDRLRSSRTPERVELWDELPYNETGKLLRREVRAELLADV